MKEFTGDHYGKVSAHKKARLLAVTTFHPLYGEVYLLKMYKPLYSKPLLKEEGR